MASLVRRCLAVLACLIAAVLAATPVPGEAGRRPFRVLQLNLCNSGFVGCYTGRSVDAAAALIRAHRPDVVSLNEICEDDVEALGRALAAAVPGDTVVPAFRAAEDRRTLAPFACRNGRSYGIGLLARLPGRHPESTTFGGLYDDQDTRDPEERAWVCVHAPAFAACTTHLANTSPAVALAQCGYLLRTAIPAMHARAGPVPTVVAGDFNLGAGSSPDVRSCLPVGYLRRDDGSVQQVMTTADFTAGTDRVIDMEQTTDHPGLLVEFAFG